jgi:HEPN domain-containing protein
LAESRIDVLLKISQVNIARAEKRFNEAEYDSAVFHASLAVESAANALILKLGGDEAKDHRAMSGLAAIIRRTRPDWLREERWERLLNKGGEIRREVVYARYPLKVAGRWVTPMEYYTVEKASMITDNAKSVTDGIRACLATSSLNQQERLRRPDFRQ